MYRSIFFLFILTIVTLLPIEVNAGDLPNHRFIHANGEATRSYSANIGEINFELTELDPDPEACLNLILSDSHEVFQMLNSLGIGDHDIQAAQVKRFISPVEYLDTPENQKKYRLLRAFHVVVRDLEQWDAMIKALATKPYLGNFTVNFSRHDLSQIKSELLDLAIQEAKEQAKTMASSLSVKLDSAMGVSSSPLAEVSSALGLVNAGFNRAPEVKPDVNQRDFSVPAQLRYSMHVNILYKIK